MIGLILWAVLIFIIVCLACPGFFTALIITLLSIAAIYVLVLWIQSKFFGK